MTDKMITLPFKTLHWEGGVHGDFFILDQRKLPHEKFELKLDTVEKVFDAIKTLAVRGAPAIGAAAAYGLVVGARNGKTREEILGQLSESKKFLASSRPTAHNLFWALNRVSCAVAKESYNKHGDGSEILETLLTEAKAIEKEDAESCMRIGCEALKLLPDPIKALTHCNAGALATCGIGTALAPFYLAQVEGREIEVFARETRPLLQGARLTAWELLQAGINTSVIADAASAHLLSLGRVNCIIVGADRIAINGDTANKIGTYELAIAAREHKIPFYIAAPISTFDPSLESGKEIVIEERAAGEITNFAGLARIAPEGISCFNPAFDVTPAEFITGIITECGTAIPVNKDTVSKLVNSSSR